MKTIAEVKALNARMGYHYFDRSTMRFFNSRVESGLYSGRFFITSERMELSFPKRYSVRVINPETGDIQTVGEFQGYSDIELARIAARIAAMETI